MQLLLWGLAFRIDNNKFGNTNSGNYWGSMVLFLKGSYGNIGIRTPLYLPRVSVRNSGGNNQHSETWLDTGPHTQPDFHPVVCIMRGLYRGEECWVKFLPSNTGEALSDWSQSNDNDNMSGAHRPFHTQDTRCSWMGLAKTAVVWTVMYTLVFAHPHVQCLAGWYIQPQQTWITFGWRSRRTQ